MCVCVCVCACEQRKGYFGGTGVHINNITVACDAEIALQNHF